MGSGPRDRCGHRRHGEAEGTGRGRGGGGKALATESRSRGISSTLAVLFGSGLG